MENQSQNLFQVRGRENTDHSHVCDMICYDHNPNNKYSWKEKMRKEQRESGREEGREMV